MVASVLANVFGGRKGRKFKPEDFMPRPAAPAPAQEPERKADDPLAMLRQAEIFIKMIGGKDLRSEEKKHGIKRSTG